jgi:hypothetical protein
MREEEEDVKEDSKTRGRTTAATPGAANGVQEEREGSVHVLATDPQVNEHRSAAP